MIADLWEDKDIETVWDFAFEIEYERNNKKHTFDTKFRKLEDGFIAFFPSVLLRELPNACRLDHTENGSDTKSEPNYLDKFDIQENAVEVYFSRDNLWAIKVFYKAKYLNEYYKKPVGQMYKWNPEIKELHTYVVENVKVK